MVCDRTARRRSRSQNFTRLNIIGDDKSGHYLFDRDVNTIAQANQNPE